MILKYSIYYTISSVIIKIFGFIVFLYVAKKVSIKDYGLFGLFYAIQIGISTFSIAGINEVIVGKLKKHNSFNKKNLLFAHSLVLFLILSVTTTLMSILIYYCGVTISFDYTLISIVVMIGILTAFTILQSQMLRLQEKHNDSLIFHALTPLSGFVFAIVFFYFYQTIESYFIGQLFGIVSIVFVAVINKKAMITFRIDENIKLTIVSLFPFLLIAFLGWMSGYGNNLIINKLFLVEDVAKFTFLMTIASAIQIVASSLNMVWSPRFYNMVHTTPIECVEQQNKFFYSIQSLCLGVFSALLLILFPMVFEYFNDLTVYSHSSFELMFLFLGYMLLPIWWHCSNYYLAFNMGKELKNIVIITSVVGIFLWILLMLMCGEIGIYIGFFVQMFLRSSWIYIQSKKHWKLNVSYEGIFIGLFITYFSYFATIG